MRKTNLSAENAMCADDTAKMSRLPVPGKNQELLTFCMYHGMGRYSPKDTSLSYNI